MNIILKNVQSIKDAEYNLPDTGLVQIIGPNSAGKSILFRALSAVVTLGMMDNEKRNAIINDEADECIIFIKYKEKALYVKLHRERNKCIVLLERGDGTQVKRFFRDGGIPELISEFGFATYSHNSICLQLFETFGQIPFVNTKNSENSEIVESVTEDTTAKQFLEAFKAYTHPKALELSKTLNKKIEKLKQLKESIVMFDYNQYEQYKQKFTEYYSLLKNAKVISLETLEIPPIVEILPIHEIQLEPLSIPPRIEMVDIPKVDIIALHIPLKPIKLKLTDLSDDLKDLNMLKMGRCPMCKRLWIEDAH